MFSDRDLARFAIKTRLAPGGCWLWQAGKDLDGYGKFAAQRRVYRAHRFAYVATRGPIPDGLTIDHLCRNRACVNPFHLQAVSHRENLMRGTSFSATNAAKTHCHLGHPLVGENLYSAPSGKRYCRTCKNRLWREWYHKES